MNEALKAADFRWLTELFEGKTGIRLGPEKVGLVVSRLLPRLRARGVERLEHYVSLLKRADEEPERALLIDQLTTHETYFFREPKHFAVLQDFAKRTRSTGAPLRVWSAACSTGEEAATIAMVLEELALPQGFEVVGTDVSPDVVRKAQRCVYPLERGAGIEAGLRQRYCLKGVGDAAGTFCLKDSLQRRLNFRVGNLLEPMPQLGRFDVIFLRNVLIYFDDERRRRIVENVLRQLKPGGLLLPGHAETVRDCSPSLKALGPAAWRYEPAPGSAS